MEYTEFRYKKTHDINSFKFRIENKDFIGISNNLLIETTRILKSFNVDSGLSLCIEGPMCCPNYAEINIKRGVPIRQYYGRE